MNIALSPAARGHVSSLSPEERQRLQDERDAKALRCATVIEHYEASVVHTQEEVHAYMNCDPDLGVSWLVITFVAFVVFVSIAGLWLEARSQSN